MPIRTTYPNQFSGPGKVITDFGLVLETFQGYCQIPATPTASVQLLDIDSPNPLSPVALTIPASTGNPRCYLSIIGSIQSASAGSDITMASAGSLKISSLIGADTTVSVAGTPSAASPRLANGNLVSGTTIPRNSVIVSGGLISTGFQAAGTVTSNQTYSVFGVNTDGAAAAAVNLFSSTPARPAFVLVTIRTLVRKFRAQTVADYPDLPRAVRELLQITV